MTALRNVSLGLEAAAAAAAAGSSVGRGSGSSTSGRRSCLQNHWYEPRWSVLPLCSLQLGSVDAAT
jgi:hypothetical protein